MKRVERGFSLLEVLVAFVILALALGVLMRIFSGGLNSIGSVEHYSKALVLAEAKLAEVGADLPLADGEYTGTDDSGLRWRVSVRPYQEEALQVQGLELPVLLYEVTAGVEWGDAPVSRRSLKLVTLRAAARP